MIAALVLAAGSSSRMGRPKPLLPLGGRPLVRHAIEAALEGGLEPVLVVVGAAAEEVEAALGDDPRVRPVRNPDHLSGQASSLRAGLRAAGTISGCEAVVVLLADQPGVTPGAIRAVTGRYRRGAGPVVQAAYSGRPGHPTLLARAAWADLEALEGDEGARSWIRTHPEASTLVELGGDPPADLDTPKDYEAARGAGGAGRQG